MNALLKKTLIVMLAAASVDAAFGDPPKAAPVVKPVPAKSVFVMPANPREGRDPFFPESPRPYEDNPAAKHSVAETSFIVKGVSVEHGRVMVIINNHTFALGDEGDVLTAAGRVHIRLAEIRPTAVAIEVNGTRREINIPAK